MKPYIIALTGRSGSGKSFVAGLLRLRGISVLDADLFARDVVDIPECRQMLKKAFGEDIYGMSANGEDVLNRKLLAGRAFASLEGKQKLIDITHPFIIESLLQAAEKESEGGAEVVIVDGSTIIDGPFATHCEKIVVVESGEGLRAERLAKRDGISAEEIAKRLAMQPSDEEYRGKADFIITNNTGEDSLLPQIEKFTTMMKGWLHGKEDITE